MKSPKFILGEVKGGIKLKKKKKRSLLSWEAKTMLITLAMLAGWLWVFWKMLQVVAAA